MTGTVQVKPGVTFPATTGPYKGTIAPGGFRILGALEVVARKLGVNLTITSGSDGEHSGPDDPHYRAEAYDVRSHDFPGDYQPVVLNAIQAVLPTDLFFVFLENPGTDDEHWHAQVKKGTTYP